MELDPLETASGGLMPPSYCTSSEGSHPRVFTSLIGRTCNCLLATTATKKRSACELCLISPAVCEPCCRHTVGLVYISYRAQCLGRSIEAARYPDGGGVEGRGGVSAQTPREVADRGSTAGACGLNIFVGKSVKTLHHGRAASFLHVCVCVVVCFFSCICEMLQSLV